jgi:hypothetical protein
MGNPAKDVGVAPTPFLKGRHENITLNVNPNNPQEIK